VRGRMGLAAAAAMLGLLSGCGSSKKSSSASTSAASSSAPSATSTGAAASAGGSSPYGAGSGSTTTSSGGVTVTTKPSKLGTILAAGPKRLTVYIFEGDRPGASACTGACTHVWPPVTTSAGASVNGAAKISDLGTLLRADGTRQVTYKGHPLYYFARDGDSGDAYGEGVNGFGSSWYVLTPAGSKVDKS
jgi:predicted lipoprotein with Yx(FWY)xxD motif